MPVVVSSWVGSLPATKNQLIDRVCSLYGFDSSDSELAARTVEWLDSAIHDLNMNTWEHSRIAESGITFTEGQQDYVLSSQCYKESQAYLVHNSDGDQAPLTFLPWVSFKRMYYRTDHDGRPEIYSMFNFEKDGRVYLYPGPDADTVTDYTLAVEYYQRLPKISALSGGDSPDIPAEFENALLYGAYKRAAIHFGRQGDVQTYAALEREALDRLKRIDAMHPDADHRFRLADDYKPVRYSNYIYPF